MKRHPLVLAFATVTMLAWMSSSALAQFKSMDEADPHAPKTGRTIEGLKADAEVDQLYRSKAGQQTPNVKADPWGDVRTPATTAVHAAKPKHKQP